MKGILLTIIDGEVHRMKQCPGCKQEVSLEDFLLKHMSCKQEIEQKEYKKILNSNILVSEPPMAIVYKNFWNDHREEILDSIDRINQVLAEKNIPLFVAENIGLSNDEENEHGWHFYICNRETEVDAVTLEDGKTYNFPYPEEYPTLVDGTTVQEMIIQDESLRKLSHLDEKFKFYFINYDNVKGPADYEEARHDFRDFIKEQKYLLKRDAISRARNREYDASRNPSLPWWSRLKHILVYKILGIRI